MATTAITARTRPSVSERTARVKGSTSAVTGRAKG